MSEKLKNCKACGQQIAKSAKTCPHCGAKNKKGHPILTGILIIFVLLIVMGSTGDNDEPTLVETNSSAPTSVTVSDQDAIVSPKENSIFTVGEIAELNQIAVSMVNVTESKGSSYNAPADGNVFVLCEFDIANNSSNEITVSSMMSFEAYCDDYACNFSLTALLEKGSKNQLDGSIAAGKKFNGVIGYEVPADWTELEVHFTPNFWSGKDIVFVVTNN